MKKSGTIIAALILAFCCIRPFPAMAQEVPEVGRWQAVSLEEVNDADMEQLRYVLACFAWKDDFYDYRTAEQKNYRRNILQAVTSNPVCIDETIYPGFQGEEYWSDTDPLGRWKGYRVADEERTDWILRDIFNVNADQLALMKAEANADDQSYILDGYYYTWLGGVGGGYDTTIEHLYSDGAFICAEYALSDFYGDGPKSMRAILKLKQFDDGRYWSLYYLGAELPEGGIEDPDQGSAMEGIPEGTGAEGADGQTDVADNPANAAVTGSLIHNNNFRSSWGNFAYMDGYMYFVQEGMENDCTGNGTAESVSLWRIAEEEGAAAEKLYTIPAEVEGGTEQQTIILLGGYQGRLYFLGYDPDETEGKLLYYYTSQDGTIADLILPNGMLYDLLGDPATGKLYLRMWNRSEDLPRSWIEVLDLASAETSELELSLHSETQMIYSVVGVGGDTGEDLYFLKANRSENDVQVINGLYCMHLDTMQQKEVAAVSAQALEDSYYTALIGNYFYYEQDRDLYAIDLSTGQNILVLSEGNGGFEFDEESLAVLTGAGIYFLTDSGMYRCDADGSNLTLQVTAIDPPYMRSPAIGEKYLYYQTSDYGISRVALEGRIFDHATLGSVPSHTISRTEQTEGNWSYIAYPAYAFVTRYLGSESNVTVPTEIGGLPVYSVGCWDDEGWTGITSLTIPEGVRSIGYIYDPDLQEVYVPESLICFTHRDVEHTFWTQQPLTLHYAGTSDQWNAMIAHGLSMYGDAAIFWEPLETDLTIVTTD